MRTKSALLPLYFMIALLAFQIPVSLHAADDSHVAKMFHPAPPLPSYEVATIKKVDPSAGIVTRPGSNGPVIISMQNLTIKEYILNAYANPPHTDQLIVGGPAWISTDAYVIRGKPPAELQVAMQNMTGAERNDQERMMKQSLLAERFHLKAHFETRQMPIFELTPAKGGLKIKPASPADSTAGSPASAAVAKASLPPSMSGMHAMSTFHIKQGNIAVLDGTIAMSQIASIVQSSQEAEGRPIVDKTGITGMFSVDDLEWSASNGSAAATEATDAPPLFTALIQKLGIKVTATKGAVEVLVIDSIDRPTEN